MAGLYLLVLTVFWGAGFATSGQVPVAAMLLVTLLLVGLAAPHVYLGLFIEKGRGRTAQTILACLSLFSFPVGTAFGIFALWVCWSAEAELFEEGVTRDDRRSRTRRTREAREEETRQLLDDPDFVNEEIPAPREGSPYAIGREMVADGASDQEVQRALSAQGLTEDEVETLMNSLGLRYRRRQLAAARTAPPKKPAATRRPAPKKPAG